MKIFDYSLPEVISVPSVDSTNDYLIRAIKRGEVKKDTVLHAGYQTAGRGAFGSWQSISGQNLIFSFCLLNLNVPVYKSFEAMVAVTVYLADSIRRLKGLPISIKWPNDIYVRDRKLSGILIENSISSKGVGSMVVGVGVNINQDQFPPEMGATSIILETGEPMNIEDVSNFLMVPMCIYVRRRLFGGVEHLMDRYHRYLYGRGRVVLLEDRVHTFEGVISGVTMEGLLRVKERSTGREFRYAPKEVKIKTAPE